MFEEAENHIAIFSEPDETIIGACESCEDELTDRDEYIEDFEGNKTCVTCIDNLWTRDVKTLLEGIGIDSWRELLSVAQVQIKKGQ